MMTCAPLIPQLCQRVEKHVTHNTASGCDPCQRSLFTLFLSVVSESSGRRGLLFHSPQQPLQVGHRAAQYGALLHHGSTHGNILVNERGAPAIGGKCVCVGVGVGVSVCACVCVCVYVCVRVHKCVCASARASACMQP